MVLNGREVDYFCGTSYYSLHGHPLVIEAACDAMRKYGLGPATSASVPPIEEVVELSCRFFAVQSTTYVISGYLGAMILFQALGSDYDVALVDDHSHYSVLDGAKTAGKKVVLFRHLDAGSLEEELAADLRRSQVPLVMTDGVFPSTGAVAPLPAYAAALARYPRSLLCVDDSHGLGVLGGNGRGTCEFHGMEGENLYRVGTLSKAFGGIGGIVLGDRPLAEKIRRNVRVPVGASLPPVPAAAAAAQGIRLLEAHPEMRKALWRNVTRMRDGLRALGFDIPDSSVPIVNVRGSASVDLRRVCGALDREDIIVLDMPPRGYSDAPDVESLRIAVFSTHSDDQIDRLLGAVRRAL